MTPEPYRAEPLTPREALTGALSSAHYARRMEEITPRPRMLAGDTAAVPLRRATYRAPSGQRRLVLAATLALAATGALQAYALSTFF